MGQGTPRPARTDGGAARHATPPPVQHNAMVARDLAGDVEKLLKLFFNYWDDMLEWEDMSEG